MNTMNLFEIATREKYRFMYKGMISVEDLWDLSLQQLNTVYQTLKKEAKKDTEDSLIINDQNDPVLQNKVEIVSYIFATKRREEEDRARAAEKAAKRQRILELIAQKEEDALANMSEEDLRKALDELN